MAKRPGVCGPLPPLVLRPCVFALLLRCPVAAPLRAFVDLDKPEKHEPESALVDSPLLINMIWGLHVLCMIGPPENGNPHKYDRSGGGRSTTQAVCLA